MFHSLGAEVAGRDESPVLEQAEKYSDCDITSTFNCKEAANLIVMSTMRNRTPLEENKKKDGYRWSSINWRFYSDSQERTR